VQESGTGTKPIIFPFPGRSATPFWYRTH